MGFLTKINEKRSSPLKVIIIGLLAAGMVVTTFAFTFGQVSGQDAQQEQQQQLRQEQLILEQPPVAPVESERLQQLQQHQDEQQWRELGLGDDSR